MQVRWGRRTRSDELSRKLEAYAERQKRFWNVSNLQAARFERVDLVSASEESWNNLADRHIERILDGVDVRPEWTVLEIGCGVGRLLGRLRDHIHPGRIVGVDISESMVRFARESLGDDPSIELNATSGHDLSAVANATVDFAYSNDVFIHIFDVDVVRVYLREVHRVLKAGGVFRFNVRHLDPGRTFGNSLGGRMARLTYRLRLRSSLNRWTPDQPAEFNGIMYLKRDLRRLVTGAGLDVLSIRTVESCLWCTCRRSA